MKKIILVLSGMFLVLSGCSSDDDNTSGLQYDSHLKVDNVAFAPTKYTETGGWHIFTSTSQTVGNNSRILDLVSMHDDLHISDEIYLVVNYPSAQEKINGTYTFSPESTTEAYYRISTAYFNFISGTVTVTDLGHNNYKLKLNNVVAKDNFDDSTKTVSGYFSGTFLPLN